MNVRRYGEPPFAVAVIHGGPGAGGEMAPVARELAPGRGILEPIQTATSLEGQIEELRSVLETHGDLPATLVGFSWGAWLSFMVAARYPAIVRKLLLVGSGSFKLKIEGEYVAQLRQTRLDRLTEEEGTEFESIVRALRDPATADENTLLARLGALASKADQYDPIASLADEDTDSGLPGSNRGEIFRRVWPEAAQLRRSGKLIGLGREVRCPVVAIHGDCDPHPVEGVREPLSAVLQDFRFILLKNCGHKPWIEREARDEFYAILEEELGS